jgi:hypothetical protein
MCETGTGSECRRLSPPLDSAKRAGEEGVKRFSELLSSWPVSPRPVGRAPTRFAGERATPVNNGRHLAAGKAYGESRPVAPPVPRQQPGWAWRLRMGRSATDRRGRRAQQRLSALMTLPGSAPRGSGSRRRGSMPGWPTDTAIPRERCPWQPRAAHHPAASAARNSYQCPPDSHMLVGDVLSPRRPHSTRPRTAYTRSPPRAPRAPRDDVRPGSDSSRDARRLSSRGNGRGHQRLPNADRAGEVRRVHSIESEREREREGRLPNDSRARSKRRPWVFAASQSRPQV